MSNPPVVVFDVNETLSDLDGLRAAFAAAGAPEHLVPTWFGGVLRDAFAAQIAGHPEPFADVAAATLRFLLDPILEDAAGAIEPIMSAFLELEVHPDVVPGVRRMAELGIRMITLSNGSADVAERLLARAGIREHLELVLSVADAGAWKPAPEAYHYAARRLSAEPGGMVLVAVHPWDLDGASRAGLRTAWIDRVGRTYPEVCATPDWSAPSLVELADRLAQ